MIRGAFVYIIKLKPLLISLLISLGVGGLAGIISSGSTDIYNELNLPALSPPSIVFPIVWTILYILMGISAYMIYRSNSKYKEDALKIYGVQLLLNFSWSLIFFNMQNCVLAFVVLVFLWVAILLMIRVFYKINPLAAYLQIPYLVWVTFAGYLNLSICLLNK